MTTYKAPLCPHCYEPLTRFYEAGEETYVWSSALGFYKLSDGSMRSRCCACNGRLDSAFPKGLWAYSAEAVP